MLSILCLDSDLQRIKKIQQDLQPLDKQFNIVSAATLKQAQQCISQQHKTFVLILAAQQLSDGEPLTLFESAHCQLIRKVLYGAEPCAKQLINGINQGQINYFLTFPYQKKALLTLVHEQISHYQVAYFHQQQSLEIPPQKNVEHSAAGSKYLDHSLYSDDELSNLMITSLHQVLDDETKHYIHRRYPKNKTLTHEGNKNRFLWFITKGKVLVKKRNTLGETQNLMTMKTGNMIGAMSFLSEEGAFSTAVTLEETETLMVDKTIFSQIILTNITLLAPFTNLLLRNFNQRLQRSVSTELALQKTLKSLDIAHENLIESEKMAVLGQLVAGIAHELNNPVTAILRGFDTLTSFITLLLPHKNTGIFSQLAQKTLKKGLTVTPLSTSEIRRRTKHAQAKVNDKRLAKQLVNMNLDLSDIPLLKEQDIAQTINLLNKYYQAGTILRNTNVCATRIADLVKSLKHYARQDSTDPTLIDIHEGLEETLVIFDNKIKNYKVITEYQQLPEIECLPIKLGQVWTNIIGNAIDAMGIKGELKISTLYLRSDLSPQVQVIIEDNGPGIPENLIDKIFELNYSSKREGDFGLGIGLTICSKIIKQHGGEIAVESKVNSFTRFIVTLPVFNGNIECSPSCFDDISNE